MASVESSFARIGARVEVRAMPIGIRQVARNWNGTPRRQPWPEQRPVSMDVRRDEAGEYFAVSYRADVSLEVPDARADDRHLLLVAREPGAAEDQAPRFLCGFDERTWFVAAVPESAAARDVQAAKDALKPEEVWESMRRWNVPVDQRDLRCTAGFVRQGEWFFLPMPEMEVYAPYILHREPIQRGRANPHVCQRLYRTSGVQVWVCDAYPNGLTEDEYFALDRSVRRQHGWRQMTRDADVFVHGYVQHPDHETIVFPFWHKVVMNTETRAAAMEDVAFLD